MARGQPGGCATSLVALLSVCASVLLGLPTAAVATDTVAISWLADGPDGAAVHRAEVLADEVAGRLAALRARPEVRAAEVDRTVTVQAEPLRDLQWNLDRIRLTAGWEHAPSAEGQVLAVLDTGVDADHPDLEGIVLPGWDALEGTDGRVDRHGHGTHVAGIAAAVGNNGMDVAGAAPGLRILPVRVLDDAGLGQASDVASGIQWAVAQGATVVNLSLGSRETSEVLAGAIRDAVAAGVVVVAAAGNLADAQPVWPAAMREVIGVTATDDTDALPAFASHGIWVDLAAPGDTVLSLAPAGGRRWMSGTSMASPLVAAVAALMRAREPDLTPAMVRSRLVYTSEDIGAAGRDDQFGYGLLAADRALLPVPAFADVAVDGPHTVAIRELVAAGITGGCAEERFCPGDRVTRGQLASFLARALRLAPATAAAAWTDTAGSPHAPAIDALAAAGITVRPVEGTYGPSTPISRGEVAGLLAAALQLTTDVLPPFTDVAPDAPYAAAIAATTDAGITTGCREERYCPDAPLTRAQTAALLGRAFLGVLPTTG